MLLRKKHTMYKEQANSKVDTIGKTRENTNERFIIKRNTI